MKKIQVTILTALVVIAMVMNYQISFAAQDEEKTNSPKSSHITEEEQDKNGHDPIYEGNETIEVKFDDYDIESKVRVTKPGSDKSKEYEHEAGSVVINLSEILNEFDGDESGNKGGVFKVEITDSNGKTKTKNIKIKDQSPTEEPEAPSDEEQENEEDTDANKPEDNTNPPSQGGPSSESEEDKKGNENKVEEQGEQEEQQQEQQQEDEQQEDEQQEDEQQDEGSLTDNEQGSEEIDSEDEAEEVLSENDKTNKDLEEQNKEIKSVDSSEVGILDSEEVLPQAIPVVVIEETQSVPASAPTVQSTLPKTGAVSTTAISGIGAAMLLLGFAISKKDK